MKRNAIFATCLFVLFASTTFAQDVVPEILMGAAQSSVPGRKIDIRGLVPGMSADEARAALASISGTAAEETTTSTTISSNGIMVRSVPYARALWVDHDGERLSARLSGLSSGNQTVFVQREADYRNTDRQAPLYEPFLASLLEKYGTPSFRKDGRSVTYLIWSYKDGQPAPCDPTGTPQCLEPEVAFQYLPQQAEAYDVIVYAAIGRETGSDRVAIFKLSSTDLSIKWTADEADAAGLRPALDAALAEARAKAPKLAL